jgi:hypothetical protein
MDTNTLAQTYVFTNNGDYFVSTIDRVCSASAYPVWYAETLVWRWDTETKERGDLVSMHEDTQGSLDVHFDVIEELRNADQPK